MNISSIDFSPILTVFGYFIVAVLFIAFIKSPWFKGLVGEFIVNFMARLSLDKAQYHLIKDVTLPLDDGGTTQIDHVIVSPYGVFVIETKNMKGWIYGGEYQKTWTQKIFKKSNKFQNPLRQNYKHLKTLQALLDIEDDQIHSVVVFVGASEFKTDMPDNVTHGFGYLRFIKSKTELVLSEWELRRITGLIESGRLERSLTTSREHVDYLKNSREFTPESSTPDCPRCGSSMVLRTARKGMRAGNQFWGCSRYPQCRSTMNL